MIEFEKKILLNRQEYLIIVTKMCKYKPVETQTNYYFDTNDFSMNNKGITYRVRAKNGEFKATEKIHKRNTDSSIENDLGIQNIFDPDIFKHCGLFLQGSLVTERIIVCKNKFCEMVVDRNIYENVIDYELEVEYLDGYEKMAFKLLDGIADILVETHINACKEEFLLRANESKSKSERFFEQKRRHLK